jgi:multidrug efflux pump subunit AcrA (membrane-fusion protein)
MPTENYKSYEDGYPLSGELEGAVRRSQRSEMVQEIVSNRPTFLIRYGIVFFLAILILLVAACWFIQFPDVVNTKAKLTSINAPKEVISKTSGKLVKLFAKENEQTQAGTLLGYMESIASHTELLALSKNTDTAQSLLSKNKIEQIFPFLNATYQNLGELQLSYQTFQQSYNTFHAYLSGGFYLRKVNMLNKDLAFLQRMHNNLLEQKELNTEDLNLSQKTFNANKSLNDDKVISDFDYRNENSKLISKKLSLPQISSAIISNEAQQNEKQKEIAELQNTIAQQKSVFSQSLNTFKSQIEDWKKKYLLVAPIDGKIAFATFLQENQELKANQIICFINPENTEYYAEIYIPQTNFGKVKTGQEVLLKFPSYPFQEYGSVSGKIDFINNINTDSGYLAKVILPSGLSTSYKKQVQFRDGLQAQGEIVIKDMRLLERFYYNIIKQVKK